MHFVPILILITLAACEPTPPSPAEIALQRQCEAGDTYACAAIIQADQAQRQAVAAVMQPTPLQMPPMMPHHYYPPPCYGCW